MLSRTSKVIKPSEKLLHDLMKPGGKELGEQAKRAGDGIRTLEKNDYSKLKSDLLDGAVEVPSSKTYTGRTFPPSH